MSKLPLHSGTPAAHNQILLAIEIERSYETVDVFIALFEPMS